MNFCLCLVGLFPYLWNIFFGQFFSGLRNLLGQILRQLPFGLLCQTLCLLRCLFGLLFGGFSSLFLLRCICLLSGFSSLLCSFS